MQTTIQSLKSLIAKEDKTEEDAPYLGALKEGEELSIVLGFDFGTQNLGIAVGNCLTQTAQPLTILKVTHNQPRWEAIEELLQEWQPEAFIVGIPYTRDGTVTEHQKIIKKFINRLHGRFGLPVFVVNEAYSSQESERYIKPSQRHKKGQLDAISAAIIVERWLQGVI
ncbi:Holliday junction resolvase RuvX [Ignatzschineria cameli]|uniref:Putative pre-16S rRNA nuclease n=1 Tax=Ignatzschineria cameli TaxID=2182793 RepID=A0A2U2ATH6_9GAMM|nr:Holliday junction resolvase RuvX [Ignatzschineria cameli]PWD87469.1 Holliday junction resolvase RuvX [Ignatzschineria cameli]PWD88032.1 Holliday junction resolvase RuvX [Ignatzschineria cameli]PWD91064.1 Holliday junction resolvase RuvX [Ignatzschineria cameli]PWD92706.1 Holliday junction resolvase RuvX [Ignatzschineria cameli]PWD93726.1 Holliday junction resolvase RuvX [Ignatzschineria cameli]